MIPNASHSLDPCGGIVEDNYGEESNAWDDGLPPSEYDGPWAGDICGACGQEFSNRTEYQKHLQHHRGRAAGARRRCRAGVQVYGRASSRPFKPFRIWPPR
jgi:hypothetical protein